jgi:hypothetical protein
MARLQALAVWFALLMAAAGEFELRGEVVRQPSIHTLVRNVLLLGNIALFLRLHAFSNLTCHGFTGHPQLLT